jgi:hypothetical protein
MGGGKLGTVEYPLTLVMNYGNSHFYYSVAVNHNCGHFRDSRFSEEKECGYIR